MMRQHIAARLRYLRNWEGANIVLLPICLVVVLISLQPPTWLLSAYSMALISLILAQGTYYWHLKLTCLLTRERQLPATFAPRFSQFRRLNLVLLAIYPALLAAQLVAGVARSFEPLLATIMWGIALLEHINYFHYQLMHDTRADIAYLLRTRRLRRSPLTSDLRAAARSSAGTHT